MKPDVTTSGEKKELEAQKPKFNEYIISAPKPQEAIFRPRLVSPPFFFSLIKVSRTV